MLKLQASLARAPYLAAVLYPLTLVPCWSKDLTPADLAHMPQASAVRVGCGISFGASYNVTDVEQAYMGVFICTGLVCAAVRMLPKPQRAACWKILRRTSLIYFWTIIFPMSIFAVGVGTMATNVAAALWLVTAFVAVPAAFSALFRLINKTVRGVCSTIKRVFVQARTLYVRVNGNEVTLKQGLHSETRIVSEDLEKITETRHDEANACPAP